ncbi:MAG: hypothetical protein HFE76_08165 [Firmicutes bacterium]|nr:hypothetical protein [Bacillota bacterium]
MDRISRDMEIISMMGYCEADNLDSRKEMIKSIKAESERSGEPASIIQAVRAGEQRREIVHILIEILEEVKKLTS